VNRSDRAAWASARTLADLCELTARWLEGTVTGQPGYCGPSDIEDPKLVPLLAALNRAGFMTTTSQVGLIQHGSGGTHAEQRAAVEGFASPEVAAWLIAAAQDAGLSVVAYDPASRPRWRYRYDRAVTVTQVNGRRFTAFGVQLPRRHIRDAHIGYGVCGRDAVKALCSAWQVTIIDPEWGQETFLWDVLAAALAENGASS